MLFYKCTKEQFVKRNEDIIIFVISHKYNKRNKLFFGDSRVILVTGGQSDITNYRLVGNNLQLNCFDTYAALPEKIIMTISAFVNMKVFKNVKYMYKVDSDIRIFKDLNLKYKASQLKAKNIQYGGFQIIHGKEEMPVGRKWHLKYSHQENMKSKWSKPYTGRYPSKFFQGSQYLLSKTFAEEINLIYNENNTDLVSENDFYEDVMIGKLAILLNKTLYGLPSYLSVGCIKQLPRTCKNDLSPTQ